MPYNRLRRSSFALCLSYLLVSSVGQAQWIGPGRTYDPDQRFSFNITVGEISEIEGSVEETTRRLFTVTGQDDKQDNAESYTFGELGLDRSDITFGTSLEYIWRYFTLQFDGSYVHAEASAVAPPQAGDTRRSLYRSRSSVR